MEGNRGEKKGGGIEAAFQNVLSFILYVLKTKCKDTFSCLHLAINEQTRSVKRSQL